MNYALALSKTRVTPYLLWIIIAWMPLHIDAQLYPDLEGDELAARLRQDFTPTLRLSFAEARDTLYGVIDRKSDTVYTIYASRAVYLPDNVDPTVYLFDQNVNTEHVYPVGRGASDGTPAHRNMFNLRPARVDVNQDRASLPFAEVVDAQADKWYYQAMTRTVRPTDERGQYAEWDSNIGFEPPEDKKGDIARSMFYIHTIYEAQVEAVDAAFFEAQRQTLCDWHLRDPVDDVEADRSSGIAVYQDGKENPYVLDCSLVRRRYCPDLDMCVTSTEELVRQEDMTMSWVGGDLILNSDRLAGEALHVVIYGLGGREIASAILTPNASSWTMPLPRVQHGTYIVRWSTERHTGARLVNGGL